jgi:prenyltransferase/squalene oxidase-like repeat protein
MSWQAAVALLLAAMLIGGFAWYERSRPPSQIVALVAALSAISVAGRVAFSPIPNVVPTTDITLIAGFALGGAPGFAVGALSGLVSNFWLGQGPWTPWQMAGWGMTGLLGAWLALMTGHRIGRLPLALVCAFAGFAYGALLDYSVMFSFGGEQSLSRYLALSARGLPFNIAHAAGNFTLALLAGPAMTRMLLRYRTRFEFAWRPGPRASRAATGAAGLILCLAMILPPALPAGRADASGGSAAAAAWLRASENGDGGYGFASGEGSSPVMTGWAALGLEAAGINPLDVDHGDATPITYLAGTAGQIRTAGDLERTILALRGAGLDPRHFQGRDLVARLLRQRGSDGSFSGEVNQAAFGVLALRAAGAGGASSQTARWLREHQNPDGGWGFAPGAGSDADTTGSVLQALAVSGNARARGSATRLMSGIPAGVAYLRSVQRPGGGFPLNGGAVNAQSTAYAVQGLAAVGVSPSSVRRGGRSPLDYLASVQAGDGHYRYSSSSDQTPVWVTGQALLAVNGRPFPLAPVPRKARRTATGISPASAGGSGAATRKGATNKPKTAAKQSSTRTAQPPATTDALPLAPASAKSEGGGGGGVPAWLIALGVAGAIGAAVWAGWLLYRRRLPA